MIGRQDELTTDVLIAFGTLACCTVLGVLAGFLLARTIADAPAQPDAPYPGQVVKERIWETTWWD